MSQVLLTLREKRINHLQFLIKELWLIGDDQKQKLSDRLLDMSDNRMSELLVLLSDAYVKQSFLIQETIAKHPEIMTEAQDYVRQAMGKYRVDQEAESRALESKVLNDLEQEIQNLFTDEA